MSNDGLLFKLFNKISKKYNTPIAGTMLTGILTGKTRIFHLITLFFSCFLIRYKSMNRNNLLF